MVMTVSVAQTASDPGSLLLENVVPSHKLTWKPKKGPVKTTVPSIKGLYGLPCWFGGNTFGFEIPLSRIPVVPLKET